jgi:serine protease Do
VTQIREYTPRTFQDEYFQYFFPEYRLKQRVKNLGSGFVISPDGYIVTNEHVVHGAIEIVVSLVAGKEYRAKLIGADYKTDVALLKIDGENLPYCEFGNSDDIIIGEWAIALGNPFGLFEIGQQPSVTVGVISSKNLDFGIQEDERLYQEMIQTDASINPGNSGGPMANALGKVIGMNTFIFTGGGASNGSIGLGFAIPINRIREIVGQLLQYGKVDRQFWTGLEVETMQPRVARYFGLTNTNGVIVTNIEANSPAAQAGLKIYDIIIEMNSVKVTSTQDIWKIIDNLDAKAGDVIPLKYIRKGRVYETKLKLGKVT